MLLILSIMFRTFEPRILQLTVDYVIAPIAEGLTAPENPDAIIRFFLWILPENTGENITWILASLAILYVVLSFLRGGVLFASDSIKAYCSEKVSKQLRDRAFAHIQQLPLNYFTNITRGELIQRCTGDIDTIRRLFHHQVIAILRIVSLFTFAFVMMAVVNLPYALISICTGPFLGIAAFVFFRRERKVWEEHEAASDKLNSVVQENLNGIRVVAAYDNQDFEIERFKKRNQEKLDMGIKHNALHSLFWPITDFLSLAQITISIIAGGYFAMAGQITVGELLVFYTYINMVTWPMRDLGRVLSEIGMGTVAMSRISEILEYRQEDYSGKSLPKLKGEIEFRNVSFRYKANEKYALKEVSFKIKPGEKVAIIGPTGSGKSTLIRLLLRLYEPETGLILLDGVPLSQYSKAELRKRIGIALQKAFLFSTTLKENIAYARPEAELPEVEKAADMAQIKEIEQIFPDGYQTMVGEKGVTLSGGQKQRVSLARTLLSDPDVLILDDITSAVDTETEQAIFEALAEPLADKTALIISHRITSIQEAERVLVLDQGALIQVGTPNSLAKEKGYYQDILAIQSGVEAEIAAIKSNS